MISVNQGTGTSVPENMEKRGTHMFLIKGEVFELERKGGRGVEIFKGEG